ncbi:MAG: pyridoxal phosphate-dependent aminotransferase [Gammaproteobacteria bacterium]|nr:pyridoxal phosphate-dependent aminotransferase [Gammaproteobacteria bacterium]MDH5593297.1 pyridoxal phosphate-dependent aminotransferase [Gammaproteobacteria bacterium]
MKIELSNRVQRVKPSPTLAVTARARELRAAGKDVIGLGAGEPDFDTPDHIKAAAIQAINDGQTKYTAVDGTPELKQAIVDKFARENALKYDSKQILVTAGGKQGFYNLAQALLNPGDEVIIPAPYWVSYPDMVLLADAKPVIISADMKQGFKITPEQLDAAITAKTRFVVLNSPSNPTGVAYTNEEMKQLGEVLLKHPHVLVVTDDIYEHILWSQDSFSNIINVCPELYERGIVLNGVSKAYSMTGWRIGYAAGPADLIGAMKKIQSQSTSNPASISQAASVAALNGDQSFMKEATKVFKERHDLVVGELNKIEGVTCLKSDGTFYAFPDFQTVIEKRAGINDDVALAEALIEHAGVALVPGSAFGAPGHLRLSYATSTENLHAALQRLQDFLQ